MKKNEICCLGPPGTGGFLRSLKIIFLMGLKLQILFSLDSSKNIYNVED